MSSVMKVDSITKSDGTAGVHIAGHIIQHQYSYYAYSGTSNETETSSTAWTASGFNVTITPSSTSSRIIFMSRIEY